MLMKKCKKPGRGKRKEKSWYQAAEDDDLVELVCEEVAMVSYREYEEEVGSLPRKKLPRRWGRREREGHAEGEGRGEGDKMGEDEIRGEAKEWHCWGGEEEDDGEEDGDGEKKVNCEDVDNGNGQDKGKTMKRMKKVKDKVQKAVVAVLVFIIIYF